MLLSMRAGGAGLNLTGGNVLVTMDFDWNPATIAQVREEEEAFCFFALALLLLEDEGEKISTHLDFFF